MRSKGIETMSTRRTAVTGLLAASLLPRPARAQTAWPSRPVTLSHGFGAGGNADSISRVVAAALSGELGQQVIVEAKPGAGGNLASEHVAKGNPDGYTLILLTGGHAVSAALYRNLRFKPVDDFAFVSLVGTFPFAIATSNDNAIKSIADLIEAARKAPGQVTFSSVGFGSTQHLTGELFAATAGIKLSHVAYRGGMQPLTDVMSGRAAPCWMRPRSKREPPRRERRHGHRPIPMPASSRARAGPARPSATRPMLELMLYIRDNMFYIRSVFTRRGA